MIDYIEKAVDFAVSVHGKEMSGHNFAHIQRVWKMCLCLATDYPEVDLTVLQLAALLHDVDDYKLAATGSDKAGDFLHTLALDDEKIKYIKQVINASSFSGNMGRNMQDLEHTLPIEAKILSDADKLDAMGAVGIVRTFNYGNKVGQPVFLPNCLPHKELTLEEYRSDTREDAHSIAHFFDKLLKLREMMFTDKAREIARKRHKFMLAFLQEFFEEENAARVWFDLLDEYEA